MSRQVKEVCKLLTRNGEIEITQKASIPMIDNNNPNRETLHSRRFHLEPLKLLVENRYISYCVMIEVKQVIESLEAWRTVPAKKVNTQPKVTAFYMSSTHSKKN